ncbi:hypothetical protein [Arsukibacterium sp.]|uniref:hypothetical protein n=1 Tax=Arsukibacterium sp. TaxID=1977258 RepID=UPI002FDA7B46
MNEQHCLQKIRDLGVRLQELKLLQPLPGKSYTTAALNYLYESHQLQRPAGAPLELTLRTLGEAIASKYQLRFQRLDADSVLDYFCRMYRVH